MDKKVRIAKKLSKKASLLDQTPDIIPIGRVQKKEHTQRERELRQYIAKEEVRNLKALQTRAKVYTEKIVDKAFVAAVQNSGGITFKVHPITNAGLPDRIVHINCRTFYVELKTTFEKCSPIQIEMHKKLKKAGIETFVLDTVIKDFYDFYLAVYNTYEDGTYYNRNPHKNV